MRTFITSILVLSLITSITAYAHNPLPDLITGGNKWTITAYDDSSPVHTQWGTQTLCFYRGSDVGTQSAGIWYSPTYFNWNGRWRQEGDQVFMTGDYDNNVGHDSMEWEMVVTTRAGAGHWREWREDGGYGTPIGYANAAFVRIGTCDSIIDTADVKAIEEIVLDKSLQAPQRVKTDGIEPLGPMDGDLLPLELETSK